MHDGVLLKHSDYKSIIEPVCLEGCQSQALKINEIMSQAGSVSCCWWGDVCFKGVKIAFRLVMQWWRPVQECLSQSRYVFSGR